MLEKTLTCMKFGCVINQMIELNEKVWLPEGKGGGGGWTEVLFSKREQLVKM